MEAIELKYQFKSNKEADTAAFASTLAKQFTSGDVILLYGELGSGKTAFAKGIGLGLNVNETVISPTFNIVRCYFKGRLPLYHIDAYRLEGMKQDIGLDEYLQGDGLCLVEWPEYIDYILPEEYLRIDIKIEGNHKRLYTFTSFGKHYDQILERVEKLWENN